MAINLTKRVKYAPNERIDLNDKLAEDTLLDTTVQEYVKDLVENDPDGRVFLGWRASTPVSWPTFSLVSEESVAVARDGTICVRDGSTSLSLSLTANTINYFYAYYDEVDTDQDARRFYISGSETTQNPTTRITRTSGLYKTTQPYAGGTPPFSGFDASANIGGKIRQLIPLYAIVVNSSNVVEGTFDYRPLFAPGVNGAGSSYYDASTRADHPHTFTPADTATLGIINVRKALSAITDRIKDLKQTPNWYDSNFNNVIAYGDIFKTTNNSVLKVAGGNAATVGGRFYLFGGAHATQPNYIETYVSRFFFVTPSGTSVGSFDTSASKMGIGAGALALPAHLTIVSPATDDALLYLSSGKASGTSTLAIGIGGSGNRANYLTFTGDATYGPGLSLGRDASGANAISNLVHRGLGNLQITAYEAASIVFRTTNLSRLYLSGSGWLTNVDGTIPTINNDGQVNIIGTTASSGGIHLDKYASGATNDPYFFFRRSNGTSTSSSNVTTNDQLGSVWFEGYLGTAFAKASAILGLVDAAPSTGSMPGRLSFLTSPSGSTTPIERMRIDSSGFVSIGLGGATTDDARVQISSEALLRQLVVGSAGNGWLDISTNGTGNSLVATNAYFRSGSTFHFANTHPSIGATGMILSYPNWGETSWFSNTSIATTRHTAFTPTLRMLLRPSSLLLCNGAVATQASLHVDEAFTGALGGAVGSQQNLQYLGLNTGGTNLNLYTYGRRLITGNDQTTAAIYLQTLISPNASAFVRFSQYGADFKGGSLSGSGIGPHVGLGLNASWGQKPTLAVDGSNVYIRDARFYMTTDVNDYPFIYWNAASSQYLTFSRTYNRLSFIQDGPIQPPRLSSEPGSPIAGDVYIRRPNSNDVGNKLIGYDGTRFERYMPQSDESTGEVTRTTSGLFGNSLFTLVAYSFRPQSILRLKAWGTYTRTSGNVYVNVGLQNTTLNGGAMFAASGSWFIEAIQIFDTFGTLSPYSPGTGSASLKVLWDSGNSSVDTNSGIPVGMDGSYTCTVSCSLTGVGTITCCGCEWSLT